MTTPDVIIRKVKEQLSTKLAKFKKANYTAGLLFTAKHSWNLGQNTMRYLPSSFLVLGLLALISGPVGAQIPEVEVNALGLQTAWISQARVSSYGRGIVSADLWVDESATQKYAVAELPNQSLVKVSASKLDEKNQPIGMEKAKAEAQAIAAKLTGQSTGFEVAEAIIPAIRLVVVTANGLVQNFDAESGKLLWSTPCGPMDIGALPAALCAAGVVVVQGDSLYLLDWLTGKQLAVKHLPNSTSSAVTVIEGKIDPPIGVQRPPRINPMAIVGDYSGNLLAYGLTEKISPWSSRMLGRAYSSPVKTPSRDMIAISTTSGMVYMYNGSARPNVQFRYESRGGITDSMAVGKDAFYIGCLDGTISKVSFAGQIVWSFHLSHAITSPALVDQENGLVFVCSESGELTAIEDATGFEAWGDSVKSNIRGPMALAGSNVICRTTDDRLLALDRKAGQYAAGQSVVAKIKSTSSQQMLPAMFMNTLTDRVYVASSNGRLQCLRPFGREIPKVFKPIAAPAFKANESQPVEDTTRASSSSDMGSDPFGAGSLDDPAGSATDPSGSSDPFGSDPFGDKP